jgi:HEAT repeat protein
MPQIPNSRSAKTTPAAASGKSSPDAAAVDAAFAALKDYDRGSSRATLLPIDEAVMAALDDKTTCRKLEQQLVTALANGLSAVAVEYVFSKLTLVGSAVCVPALTVRLADPRVATAARTVLESLPDRRADKALRDCLPRLAGPAKVGVIQSLGARRDPESVRALTALLEDSDAQVAVAAAAALGEIASRQAAEALRVIIPHVPAERHRPVADAALVCAERLRTEGRKADARALYQALAAAALPGYIDAAARRGLTETSG